MTDETEHSVYCRFTIEAVVYTQDLGSVQVYWDADDEIVGVEIMNVRTVTIDGEPVTVTPDLSQRS